MKKFGIFAVFVLALGAYELSKEKASVSALTQEANPKQSQICRATIAALMGQDASIMQVETEYQGVSYIVYNRPKDGTRWKNKCKVEGNIVYWGKSDGRWRDLPEDGKITFEMLPETIVITEHFPDGSMIQKTISTSVVN